MKKLILLLFISIGLSLSGQNYYYAIHDTAGSTPPAPASWLLLDSFPNAAFAFALNKLDKDYAGNCIQVRRSSDNDTAYIGFVNTDLDSATLKTFCAGTDCFVRRGFDQSGNGRNLRQLTAGNQPKIVSSGTIIRGDDGNPTMEFDGDYLQTVDFGPTAQPTTRIAIATRDAAADGGAHYITDGSPTHRQVIGINGDANCRLFAGSVNDYTTLSPFQAQTTWFGLFNTTASKLWINGTDLGSKNVGSGQLGRVTMGSGHSGTSFWFGTIKLLVVYPSNQTTNRTGIEAMLP
jgi:hypothetical protein